MASAEREPILGVWGLCPQRGPGAEPLVRGSGGEAPLKLNAFVCCYVYELFIVINGSCSTNMYARQLSFNFSSMVWGAMAPWPPLWIRP